jgi:hypothetical protein
MGGWLQRTNQIMIASISERTWPDNPRRWQPSLKVGDLAHLAKPFPSLLEGVLELKNFNLSNQIISFQLRLGKKLGASLHSCG